MQRAGVAVFVAAVVVIHPIGHVAALLDLGDEDARADGVQRACWDEEHIARMHGRVPRDLEQRTVLDAAGQFLPRDGAGEAVEQLRARRAVDDDPHLRFAPAVLHPRGVLIVRMHLHRQALFRVDQLDHQREAVLRIHCAAQQLRLRLQRGGERLSGKRAGRDRALAVRVAGKLPAFGQRGDRGLFSKIGL